VINGYAEKFKMAEPSDYSSSSEDDECSDPLEVAASCFLLDGQYVQNLSPVHL